jgi:hypothetical protein
MRHWQVRRVACMQARVWRIRAYISTCSLSHVCAPLTARATHSRRYHLLTPTRSFAGSRDWFGHGYYSNSYAVLKDISHAMEGTPVELRQSPVQTACKKCMAKAQADKLVLGYLKKAN